MQELLNHIKGLNEKTKAWVAVDPANRWASTYPEEAEYWTGRGITTIDEFEADGLRATIWDLYKDVHGVRPRFMPLNEMSLAELKAEYGILTEYAKVVREQEAKAHAAELEEERKLSERFGVPVERLALWGVIEAWTPWRTGPKWEKLDREAWDYQERMHQGHGYLAGHGGNANELN